MWALTSAQVLSAPLRLRLMIGPSAPELHTLHWELLCDPQDGSPLSTSENLLFSRRTNPPHQLLSPTTTLTPSQLRGVLNLLRQWPEQVRESDKTMGSSTC